MYTRESVIDVSVILHQMKYAKEILSKFDMADCNFAVTLAEGTLTKEGDDYDKEVDPTLYRQLIGSLRYPCNSRLDISYASGKQVYE